MKAEFQIKRESRSINRKVVYKLIILLKLCLYKIDASYNIVYLIDLL
jgi:hypothetical protein